jgi:predicted Zn-dependent peptidase
LSFQKGSPVGFGYDILIKSLKEATEKSLRKFMKQTILTAPGACITVFGAVAPDEAKQTLARLAKEIPWSEKAAVLIPNLPRSGAQQKSLVLNREQAVPVMSLPCPAMTDPEGQVPMDLLRNALTGMSSALFKSVREKEGLAYYTSFRTAQNLTGGHMDFFAGTAPATVGRVLEKFEEERKRLATKGLTQEEFNNAKMAVLYNISTIFQDVARYASACSSKYYLGFPADMIDRIRKEVETADLKKLNRLVKKWFSQSDIRQIVVSPEEYQF